jgi:hypothetical protein
LIQTQGRRFQLPGAACQGQRKQQGDFGPMLPEINVLGLIDISKKKIRRGVPVQYLRPKGFDAR